MIVNKHQNYSREVGKLHHRIQQIQYQLANVKLQGRLQTLLEIVVRKEGDCKITAFERIKRIVRKNKPYVAMLVEISVRRVFNGVDAVRKRLLLSAFVRMKMLPVGPRPLLPQNIAEPPTRQRRRDIVPNRKQQPAGSCESQNVELKHKIKEIQAKFHDFVNDLQRIAPEVVSKSLSPVRKR